MNNISRTGAQPSSSNINTDTGAISSAGLDVVDTYVDFMCPICNQFEKTEGETIKQLVSDNKITLNIHPVSILDRRRRERSSPAGWPAMFASPRRTRQRLCVHGGDVPEPAAESRLVSRRPDRLDRHAALSRVISEGDHLGQVHQVRPGTHSARRRQGDTTLVWNGAFERHSTRRRTSSRTQGLTTMRSPVGEGRAVPCGPHISTGSLVPCAFIGVSPHHIPLTADRPVCTSVSEAMAKKDGVIENRRRVRSAAQRDVPR
jgi:hypothetical protein